MNPAYDLASATVRWLYDRRIHGPAVLDPATAFPRAQSFIGAWRALREEALAVGARLREVPTFHELMPAQADISANDGLDWRMFVLKAYGVTIDANLAACPTLGRLLASAPEVLSACFSCVAGGKHIPPHRGPFRGVLRFHLGLVVPPLADGRPGTVLEIDGVPHRIGEGDWLLWDDTYPHELRNETDRVRIALLLDVRRPGMTADMALLSSAIVRGAGAVVRARVARGDFGPASG